MNYNYHTHTYLCGHATGSIEEYVLKAIEGGIKYMGFSDHAPFKYPDGFESDFRVPVSEVPAYFDKIGLLREKYKRDIDIKIGFEMEYFPEHFNVMLKNVIDSGAEYLILGQHFIIPEHPVWSHTIEESNDPERLNKYVSLIIEAIKTGAFTYVAHPDIINFTGDAEVFKTEMTRLCEASKKFSVPLEINFLGIRDNRNYPNKLLWEIAGKCEAPVTFGFDAHDVDSVCDKVSLEKAKELVKKYNLNYIGKPELKKLF